MYDQEVVPVLFSCSTFNCVASMPRLALFPRKSLLSSKVKSEEFSSVIEQKLGHVALVIRLMARATLGQKPVGQRHGLRNRLLAPRGKNWICSWCWPTGFSQHKATIYSHWPHLCIMNSTSIKHLETSIIMERLLNKTKDCCKDYRGCWIIPLKLAQNINGFEADYGHFMTQLELFSKTFPHKWNWIFFANQLTIIG